MSTVGTLARIGALVMFALALIMFAGAFGGVLAGRPLSVVYGRLFVGALILGVVGVGAWVADG